MSRPFPEANPHGDLRELFDDIFFVTGGVRMAPAMSFSRNMTVVRQGTSLTLINTMRLDDAGLAALDALGKVEHVIRIAGFHGMDDPFYKDRYGATVWAVKDQPYAAKFDATKRDAETYFDADNVIEAGAELPIADASLIQIKSARPGEGLVLLEREGGILVSGDCLQNWYKSDPYFSFAAKVMMKLMGFIKPHNVGPGWVKSAKPDPAEVGGLLDLSFEHVLPAHGAEVIGDARKHYQSAIERVSS